MGQFATFASLLREQLNTTMSRSDVLRPLAWLLGILTFGLISLVYARAPEWLLIIFVAPLLVFMRLYGFAYLFCLINDRDALRSEKYSLHKLAIEHGVYGDSEIGEFREPNEPVLVQGDKVVELTSIEETK